MNNECDSKGCVHNRDGQCLDKELLSDPYKQTGCLKPDVELHKEAEK